MKHLTWILIVFAWTGTALAENATPDTKIGDFVFPMPTGWIKADKGPLPYLLAPLQNKGTAYIALTATDLGPDLKTTFSQNWTQMQKQYRLLQGGNVAPVDNDQHLETLAMPAIVADQRGVQWNMILMGVKYQNRMEIVMYMSCVPPGPGADACQADFEKFAANLQIGGRLPGAGNPDALPQAKGKFNGIYRSLLPATGDPLSLHSMVGYHYRYVTLLADGRFKEGLAEQGLFKYDEDADISANPIGWGIYEMQGDEGRVTFPATPPLSPNALVWPIKETPDKLIVHGDEYTLMLPCDGVKLEGTFRRSDYQTAGAPTQGITFSPNGTFVDEGAFIVAGVMTRNPRGDGFDFDDGAPGQGTYRVGNYTLELTYSNGKVKRTNIYIEPGKPTDHVTEFMLNTRQFILAR